MQLTLKPKLRKVSERISKKIIAEPGRFLVASSGVLESEVLLIKVKKIKY